jgi:hypothetical protein
MLPASGVVMLAAAWVPTWVPAGRSPSASLRAFVRCVSLPVDIRSTGLNSRRISSAIDINASLEDVWAIITDYDRISVHAPNVLRSRVVSGPGAGIRVFQEGAQNIAGFEFRASLLMEMTEVRTDALRRPLPAPRLTFRCPQSELIAGRCARREMACYHSKEQPFSLLRPTTQLTHPCVLLSFDASATSRPLLPYCSRA